MSSYSSIVEQIDRQIAHLLQVRSSLAARGGSRQTARPAHKASQPVKAARQLSDEARARIAAAQKKRWAAQKKATVK